MGDTGDSFHQRHAAHLQAALDKYYYYYHDSTDTPRPPRLELTCLNAPIPLDDTTFTWWTLPPGERSYTVDTYENFDTTSHVILQALQQTNYDFVLGHSQGGIICAALCALGRIPNDSMPRGGFVWAGIAMPNPYRSQVLNMVNNNNNNNNNNNHHSGPPKADILFVHGIHDPITSYNLGEEVYQAFERSHEYSVQWFAHDGGHEVPVTDDDAMQYMVQWMKERMEQTTKNTALKDSQDTTSSKL